MEDREDSDIDFIVDLPVDSTMFEFASLRYELTKILEREFDLLTYNGLNENLLKAFIKNSITLEELLNLTKEDAIQNHFTNKNRLQKNLNGLLWNTLVNDIPLYKKKISTYLETLQ